MKDFRVWSGRPFATFCSLPPIVTKNVGVTITALLLPSAIFRSIIYRNLL